MNRARRRISISILLAAAILGVASPSQAAVINFPCDNSGSAHCYAIRTQGMAATPTLSNLQSTSAWVNASCQFSSRSGGGFADSEIWNGTPSRLSGGNLEWVETGITTGTFNGVSGAALQDFYWARMYASSGSPVYQEYLLPGTAGLGIDYVVSIRYIAGNGWRIYHGSNDVGGGSANQAPGAHQWIEAGAETLYRDDGNAGRVTHLTNNQNGTTYSGLTGDIYVSGNGYNYSTSGPTELRFATNSTPTGLCRSVPASTLPSKVVPISVDGLAGAALSTMKKSHPGTLQSAGYVATTVRDYERAYPGEAGTLSNVLSPESTLIVAKINGKFDTGFRQPKGSESSLPNYTSIMTVWSLDDQRAVSNTYSIESGDDLGTNTLGANTTAQTPLLHDLRSLGTVVSLPIR